MNTDKVISILNGLIQTCRDGQEGFRLAAEKIENSEFRRLFNIFSQQRAQFAKELQAEVHRLGGEAEENGTLTGWFHRGLISLEAAVTEGDQGWILGNCQSGDEAAVNKYQEALAADLPVEVEYVVKRQLMDVQDAYLRLCILKRAA
jgi:uncharacterized protein (TIGR02284 family)